MPNKRKEGLETLSAWIESDLKSDLRELAKKQGKSVSELVTEILENQVSNIKERDNGKGTSWNKNSKNAKKRS